MHVGFQIIADGTDVSGNFKDRLVRLTITDQAGSKSDTAEIVIDDRGYRVALPDTGAKLQISLGLAGGLVNLGSFIVDDLSGEMAPDLMTISAKGTNMLGGIGARKSRDWQGKTVQDIVGQIAGEHGLTPQVSDSLKPHKFGYLAQTSESDLNFLSRIAKDLDAVAKAAGDNLVFMKRGEGKAADGADLPVFTISRSHMSGGRWQLNGRGKHGRVVAEWGDRGAAKIHKVTAGDKDPEFVLRHRYTSENEAQRAAQSALDKSRRGSGKISIQLGGFWGDLMAEASVDLRGIKPELEGKWLVTRVQHRLASTLTTSFDAERDNEDTK